MGAEEKELTLEGLAQRLESLERENERMHSENAELRDQVAALGGSGAHRDELAEMRGSDTRWDGEAVSEFEGRVSRGTLLSNAAAAAVAAVAAGTLLNTREAKAHHQDDYFSSDLIECHTLNAITGHFGGFAVRGRISSDAAAVDGTNFGSGPGVTGEKNGTGPAVEGTANAARARQHPRPRRAAVEQSRGDTRRAGALLSSLGPSLCLYLPSCLEGKL